MKIPMMQDRQTPQGTVAVIAGKPKLGTIVTIMCEGQTVKLGQADLLHLTHQVLTVSDLAEPRDRRLEFVHAIKQMHPRHVPGAGTRSSRRLHGPLPKV